MEIKLPQIIKSWIENIDNPDFNSLYIDIPFCSVACLYCKYRKNFIYTEENVENYLSLLEKEMGYFSPLFQGKYITALHVGGGSPSVLTTQQLYRLGNMIDGLYTISREDNGTRTIEFNPADLSSDKIKAAFSSDLYNRTTLGIQSFDESVIRFNKRTYISPEKLNAIISEIRSYNPNININIDMMMGLVGESEKTVISTFELLSKADINRITIYIDLEHKDGQLIDFVNSTLKKLNTTFQRFDMDSDLNYDVKSAYLFFNKDRQAYYDYIYSLGPILSNRIGFGPGAQSQIKNIDMMYVRDYNLDFTKSKYEEKVLDRAISEDEIISIFKRNDRWIF